MRQIAAASLPCMRSRAEPRRTKWTMSSPKNKLLCRIFGFDVVLLLLQAK